MLMKKDFLNLRRSRWLLLSLFALLVGASPTWADAYTTGFESTDGWSTISDMGGEGFKWASQGSYASDYELSTTYKYQGSNGLYNGQANNGSYFITPKLAAGTISFWAAGKKETGGSNNYVKVYKCTDNGDGTFTIDSENLSTHSNYNYSGSDYLKCNKYSLTYTQYSFDLDEDTHLAFYLSKAGIDNFFASNGLASEAVDGPALTVKDGSTSINSPYAFNFGLATAGTTHEFTLSNPGTAAVEVGVSETGDFGATLSATSIAAGETATLTITMPATTGSSEITISSTTDGIDDFVINASGTLRDPAKVYEAITTALPTGWSVDGSWSYDANGAYTTAWYINPAQGNIARMKTPLLTVAAGEKFIVEAKGHETNNTSYQHMKLQYSTDGTTWTDLGEELALDPNNWKTFTVTAPNDFVAGNYYIGILASRANIRLFYGGEKVSGSVFAINVTENAEQDFGDVEQNATAEKTFTITNNGDAAMNVSVAIPTGFEAEVTKTSSIKFTNNKSWSAVRAYAWNSSDEELTASWPGDEVEFVGKNDYNQDIYRFVIPEGAAGIIFNNNNNGEQTVDITDFAHEGYYVADDKDGSGHWNATAWAASQNVSFTIAAGETGQFKVAMNTSSVGDKSGDVVITNNSLNKTSFTIPVKGYVIDHSKLYVTFNGSTEWPTEIMVHGDYWDIYNHSTTGYARQTSTSAASSLILKPLTVVADKPLKFKAAYNYYSNKQLGIRYTTNGGVSWTDYQWGGETDLRQSLSSSFSEFTIENIPAGTAVFEFKGKSVQLDDIIADYTVTSAPLVEFTEVSDNISGANLQADATASYTLKNIGNADYVATVDATNVTVGVTGEEVTYEAGTLTVPAGKTATITATMAFAAPYGAKNGSLAITSESWVGDINKAYTATLVDPTAFLEDFSDNARPAGWYSEAAGAIYSGWVFTNGDARINTGIAKPMITEKIGAEEGKNVLSFNAQVASGESSTLNVYTSSNRKDWSAAQTFNLTAASQNFNLTALTDGNYYVKFVANNAIVDNISGVKKVDLPAHDLFLASATLPFDDITPIDDYTATVNVASLIADETVAVELWMKKADEDAVMVAETTGQSISNGETKPIEVKGKAPSAGTFDVYAKVVCEGVETMETDKVSVTVAATTELAITQFAPVAAAVKADEDNNFTAEFNVTVKNNGSTAIDVANIDINITNANEIKYDGVTKTNETVFLTPGEYANDNAKLFIYRWSTASDQEWGEFTKISDNLWSADLNGKTKFIVVRKPSDATSGFDGAWNQSVDLTAADGICFTFNGWDDKDGENHHNFAASNSALLPNNATAKMRFALTTAAGNGGNLEFKAQESITDTWWTNGFESTVTVIVTAAPTLALTESDYRSFEEGNKYYEVTLDRPFIVGWNTLVLPFNFAASKINGATFYEFGENNNGELKFTKVDNETLTAGTPYLVYLTAPIEDQIIFNKVEITAATAGDVENEGAHFIGTYRTNTSMVGNYGVTPTGTVQKGGEGSWMKAYRAYITMPDGQNARIAIFDETTGISRILSAKEMNDLNMFNMQGQRVNNNAKGVIIKDGKKIVRK